LINAFDVFVRVLLVVATGSLFGIVLIAYLRLKNSKMLLISIGFGFFLMYALVAIPEILGQQFEINENLHLLLHLIALIFILWGILKD